MLIDGLILNTCPIGGSNGVTLHDVRSISHPSWGDGLNVFASSNVLYDRVFCRNSDDCTTAYATRKGFSGSARNIRMRNSTLWADVAHPIFIGIHGAAAGPNPELRDTVENGYNEERKVRNITFEGLKINGRHIYDKMPGKPAWYSTGDYVRISPIWYRCSG